MREPTLTIIPPSSAGIDPDVDRDPRARSRGAAARSSAAWRASFSGCATVTSAVTSPRRSASLPQIGLDHRRHREEAPVARHDPEKIAGQLRQAGALGERGDRLALLVARHDRAAHQADEIAARRAASRAIRADRRRRRRARGARRPDRTAPPHNVQPGRRCLSLRKPTESGPQSARRREDGRDNSLPLGDLGATARSRGRRAPRNPRGW